jgi:cell division protein FtsN
MARDYKDTAKPKAKGRAGPLLLGMMIGLLVGVLGSAGVALYVSKMPNPFQKQARGKEGPGPEGSEGGGEPKAAAKEPPAGNQPRFTFYDDLPKGNQSAPVATAPAPSAAPPPPAGGATPAAPAPAARPADVPQAAAPAPPPPPAAVPGASAQAPSGADGNSLYLLQAGAFQNQTDADNQKRAIALIGLDARIRPADTPDKGRVYRVRLGPYNSLAEATQAVDTLKENGIAASLVKVPKGAGKPPPSAAANN